MELNELLMKRRSVRKYEKTQISENEVEELISSSLYAASWKNSETGRYYGYLFRAYQRKRREQYQAGTVR